MARPKNNIDTDDYHSAQEEEKRIYEMKREFAMSTSTEGSFESTEEMSNLHSSED